MVCMQANDYKPRIKIKFVFILLAIAVVAGLSTAAFTAGNDNSNGQKNSKEISFFDPFALETVYFGTTENEVSASVLASSLIVPAPVSGLTNLPDTIVESSVISRPAVRIPYRPPLRSPFRPPWVPGPPSWYPGDPPWEQ